MTSDSQKPYRAALMGAGIGVAAAFVGVRVGPDLTSIALVLGAAIGAGLAALLSKSVQADRVPSDRSRQLEGISAKKVVLSGEPEESVTAVEPESPQDPPLANSNSAESESIAIDWPVETHEVRLKLDLAKEYLELGEPRLAVDLLDEVLSLETAVAQRLAVELLR